MLDNWEQGYAYGFEDEDDDPLCQCQGCGLYERIAKLGTFHVKNGEECGEFC